MRYILIMLLITCIAWCIGNSFCLWQDSDDEICSSTGLECGVTVSINDLQGERQIRCGCIKNATCNLNTFKCDQGTK